MAPERVRSSVWATDASAAALEVAGANAVGLGRAAARVRLAEGSWFDALPTELRGRFDLVVSNPPYVPAGAELDEAVTAWEPAGALYAGPDGTDALVHLVRTAPAWLTSDGALVLELSPEQGPALAERALGHFAEAELREDLTGRVRSLVARRPG
jgi:release factor glutamine methyltransferase